MPGRFGDKQDQTNDILGEGQAALWLTESLILALLEANLLDTDTILEAIDTVIAAKKVKAAEGSERDIARAAITHLASISASVAAAKVAVDSAKVKSDRGKRKKHSM